MLPKGARLTIFRLCRFAPASLQALSGEVLERGRRAIECCRQMHSEASVTLQDNDALVTANQNDQAQPQELQDAARAPRPASRFLASQITLRVRPDAAFLISLSRKPKYLRAALGGL